MSSSSTASALTFSRGATMSVTFPFNGSGDERDPQSAIAAALALQAILNPGDLGIVGRAAGCDSRTNCQIKAPTLFDGRASQASIFSSDPRPIGTAPFLQFIDPADDLSQDPFAVYARCTLAPEPSVAVLLGLGLCALRRATAHGRSRFAIGAHDCRHGEKRA